MAPSSTSARVGSYLLGPQLETTKTYVSWQSQHADLKFGARDLMVKQLLPELAENPRMVEQCALRARRAKHLHHAGIAEVVDVIAEGDRCYIVTELLEGYCLREVLDRVQGCGNALPPWFSLQLARQLSRALEHAHELASEPAGCGPIHHQDVSPHNILLTSTGQAKLFDFGLSRAALLGTSAIGVRRWSDSGEFDLWAPHFGDVQSDIVGLARVLYEMLAGKPMGHRFVPPSKHAPWVTPELDHLLARALGLPGPHRFTTMHEFRVALVTLIRRQRHQADSSHLAGLLSVVMTGCQSVAPVQPDSRVVTPPAPLARSETILPAPMSPEERAEQIALAAHAEVTRTGFAQPEPSAINEQEQALASSEPSWGASCRWDAAVERIRRESERPPPLPSLRTAADLPQSVAAPDSSEGPISARESFEQGLDLMKLGNLSLAEAAWQRALELDPSHRLCQVNLKLLRKRRNSEFPPRAE